MSLPKPDYERGGIRLYCADCMDLLPLIEAGSVDAVVTDPPYGIEYESGMSGHDGGVSLPGIVGDEDTRLRDAVVDLMRGTPMVVFGTHKRPKPIGCSAVLIWEKGDHVGMGDLSMPWKPNIEEIYIIGSGFSGHRGSSVIRENAPVSWNSVRFGRVHPHEKPVSLIMGLIEKCPSGTVLDPFLGSGTTAVACIRLGRQCIGIEKERKYFDIAVRRVEQAFADEALIREVPTRYIQGELL